jgi:hypothetical protein
MRKSPEFFICQQGFAVPNDNPHLYSALMLQPRIIVGLTTTRSPFRAAVRRLARLRRLDASRKRVPRCWRSRLAWRW